MRLGGHDVEKIHAAYHAAVNHRGAPTVILARTIKGYGLGEAGEGKNITHQQKALNEQELLRFRDRFDIPLSDEEVVGAPLYRPAEDSSEMDYLPRAASRPRWWRARSACRAQPTHVPARGTVRRVPRGQRWPRGVDDDGLRSHADRPPPRRQAREARRTHRARRGAHLRHGGALPRSSASTRRWASSTTRSTPTSCSSTASRRTARSSRRALPRPARWPRSSRLGRRYASYGMPMIPFFIYYSMFGFQRVGDLAWAAADNRTRGFLLGGTSGRTTLAGEGLQHQDGHSHLLASTIPTLLSYDPAYAYEVAVLIREGIRRMHEQDEDVFYYLTVGNEPYPQPPMPEGDDVRDGILRGHLPLPRGAGQRATTRPPPRQRRHPQRGHPRRRPPRRALRGRRRGLVRRLAGRSSDARRWTSSGGTCCTHSNRARCRT